MAKLVPLFRAAAADDDDCGRRFLHRHCRLDAAVAVARTGGCKTDGCRCHRLVGRLKDRWGFGREDGTAAVVGGGGIGGGGGKD